MPDQGGGPGSPPLGELSAFSQSGLAELVATMQAEALARHEYEQANPLTAAPWGSTVLPMDPPSPTAATVPPPRFPFAMPGGADPGPVTGFADIPVGTLGPEPPGGIPQPDVQPMSALGRGGAAPFGAGGEPIGASWEPPPSPFTGAGGAPPGLPPSQFGAGGAPLGAGGAPPGYGEPGQMGGGLLTPPGAAGDNQPFASLIGYSEPPGMSLSPAYSPTQPPGAARQTAGPASRGGGVLAPPGKSAVDSAEYDLLAQQGRAVVGALGAEAESAEERRGILERGIEEQDRLKYWDDALARNREAEYKDQFAKYQKASDDLMKETVDPNRFWSNVGVGGRIFGAIAMGLGAFGAALAKTPNYAMQIIESAINRDLEAQKATLGSKQLAHRAKGQLLDRMRSQFKDENEADAAARNFAWTQVQRNLLAIGGKQAPDFHRQMEEKTEEYRLKLQLLAATRAEEKAKQQAAAYAAAQQRRAHEKAIEGMQGYGEVDYKQFGEYVPAVGGFIPDPTEKRAVANAVSAASKLDSQVAELKEIVSKPWSYVDLVDRARARVLTEDIMRSYQRTYQSSNSMSNYDQQAMAKVIQDPNEFWGFEEPKIAAAEVLQRLGRNNARLELQNSGFRPAEEMMIKDPKTGALKPIYRLGSVPQRKPLDLATGEAR